MTRQEPVDNATNSTAAPPSGVLATFLEDITQVPPDELFRVVEMVGQLLGVRSARMLVADYALLSFQEMGEHGTTGVRQPIEGTFAGRAFAHGEIVVSGAEPIRVWIPLTEGSERLGVLELAADAWDDEAQVQLSAVVHVLVLVLVSKRRYTDVTLRARRAQPLSMAAEMQWDLLPPLACSSDCVSVSGILEPAYSIGGDSFDYAFNPNRVDFAIVDAVGHGMTAVLLSVVAINSLRNARREHLGLDETYHVTGDVIKVQSGTSAFVTGQFGWLAVDTGVLTWINAGHPLPLLVRNQSFVGELSCSPSLPMGLDGSVREISTENLQPGDRVLFYTDGVTETRSPNGEQFGIPRLADLLVRATLDHASPAETVRRLSASITSHNGIGLTDDATLLILEYQGARTKAAPTQQN